jgi:predicted dienelactone hydrolase
MSDPDIRKNMETFVGYCPVDLVDEHNGETFPMAVMYPAMVPGKTERLGRYVMDLANNAGLKEGRYPLVIISHGSGGSHLAYWTLAYHLARNGFIVGMPEHPGNNYNDNTLVNTVDNLVNRPKHVVMAINWFFLSRKFVGLLKPDSVAIIGHSMGGYTALAVAGGVPASFPRESPDGHSRQINVTPDRRVRALVLLAPASYWFRKEGALKEVDIPILMLTGEKDEYMPRPYYHAKIILDGVPDRSKVRCRIVKNAGHFSFLSKFPESMTNKEFPPSQDPPGFDRSEFLPEMNNEVLEFLLREV